MSYAAAHPVYCAARAQGCPASIPGSKWDKVKAGKDGWFFSRENDEAYCPEHVPDWVDRWRANRKAWVDSSYVKAPPVAACEGCDWTGCAAEDNETEREEVREAALDHAKAERHVVTVTFTQTLTYTPPEA